MSVYHHHKGSVAHVSEHITALVEYVNPRKRIKPVEVTAIGYPNDAATLYVSYSDGALRTFAGTSANELREWADRQKGWPRADYHNVATPYPTLFEEPEPEAPVRVARVRRERQTAVVKRVRRSK